MSRDLLDGMYMLREVLWCGLHYLFTAYHDHSLIIKCNLYMSTQPQVWAAATNDVAGPRFGNNCIDVGDYDWMGVFDQAMFNDDVGGGIQGDTPLEVAAAMMMMAMAIYLSMQPDATIK